MCFICGREADEINMIEGINKIRLERPAWFVFEFLADIEHSPLWNQLDMRAIQTTPGPVNLGTEYRLVHTLYERVLRVVEFKKDRLISVRTVESAAPRVELRMHLHPEDDQLTSVTLEWELDTGMPGLVERLASGKIKQSVSESLYNLRELLETGSVTLDNGREIQIPHD
jgi:hypothetical protein